MFVGVGASRVRDLFETRQEECSVHHLIDEIGRCRPPPWRGWAAARRARADPQQLLVEMDGFESNEGVILVAAIQSPDVLDPALLRPAVSTAAGGGASDLKGRETDSQSSHEESSAGRRCEPAHHRARTPGFVGAISRTW